MIGKILFMTLTALVSGASGQAIRGLAKPQCIPRSYNIDAGSNKPRLSFKRIGPQGQNHLFRYADYEAAIGNPNSYDSFNMEVYKDYKYGTTNFGYMFDSCNNSVDYNIKIGFAELNPEYCPQDGNEPESVRVFNVVVGEQNRDVPVATGLNVVDEVGCFNAYIVETTYRPSGSNIHVRFTSDDGSQPMVSWISITPIITEDQRRHLKECK